MTEESVRDPHMHQTEPPTPPVLRETLTIQKAAARADVSRRTIYNWIDAGKLDYVRTAGGRVRVFADSLFKAPTA